MLSIARIDNSSDFSDSFSRDDFIDFLHTHLGRFRDSKEAIGCSIDYAFSGTEGKGGFLLAAHDERNAIVGAAVINRTGMEKFIPPNILVYIAVDGNRRGQGYGRQMVERIQQECGGGIALHVEYDNPARRLYERLGFTSKYAEMRYDPAASSSLAERQENTGNRAGTKTAETEPSLSATEK